jgi:hypothetical protein
MCLVATAASPLWGGFAGASIAAALLEASAATPAAAQNASRLR